MTSPRQAISQIRKFKEFLGKRVWRLFLAAILIGACLFLIESSFIFVMQGFLRAVKLVDADKLSLPAWYPTSLFSTILLLTLFGVFRGIAFSLRTYVAGLTFQVFNRIQRSRILEYGLTHADKVTSHEIIELFTERVGSAGTSLGGLSGFLMNGTSAVLLLALGTKLAPKEMMLGIFLLLLLVYPLKWMGAKVHSYGENLLIDWRQANRILLEGMRNNFLLRVYDLIPREVAEGQNHLGRFEQHYKKYYSTHSIKSSIPIIAGVLEISTITYVSIHFIGTPPIRLIGFFYIFIRLAQTAAEMNATLSEFRLHLPGFKLLYSWHLKMAEANASRAPAVRPDGTEIPGPPCDRVEILLNEVSFSYPGGAPIFRGLNLKVSRGDTLVIQGESGAGKSTLLSLILGIVEPNQGSVSMNGLPIREVRKSLCSALGYVGPDPFLVAGTVRENLLYAHPDPATVSDDEIWNCLGRAQLAGDVTQFPRQLNEPLHEHTQLSTGQKQRMAIARALLRSPKLLILDEASANLDSATEGLFIDSLQKVLQETTTIIISHKASFDRIASHKLILKKDEKRSDGVRTERIELRNT
ncbi:MAG: ATP-binding cassette domain-containing protein [Bdellovibrionota bacterium]